MKGFSKISDLLGRTDLDKDKSVSFEFQKYGYELARELDDLKSRSLYIKLAKDTPRHLLERAKSFVSDAQNVRNKARLFMWKLGELKKEMTQAKAGVKMEN